MMLRLRTNRISRARARRLLKQRLQRRDFILRTLSMHPTPRTDARANQLTQLVRNAKRADFLVQYRQTCRKFGDVDL